MRDILKAHWNEKSTKKHVHKSIYNKNKQDLPQLTIPIILLQLVNMIWNVYHYANIKFYNKSSAFLERADKYLNITSASFKSPNVKFLVWSNVVAADKKCVDHVLSEKRATFECSLSTILDRRDV